MTRNRVLVPLTCVECGEAIVPVVRQFLAPEKSELLFLHVGGESKEASAVHDQEALEQERKEHTVGTYSQMRPSVSPGREAGQRLQDEVPEEGIDSARVKETKRQEIAAQYDEIVDLLRDDGYVVSVSVRLGGEPATDILAAADAQEVDLIAMAVRAQSRIAWLFPRQVAEKVMHGGMTPMLFARIQ